jgi:hypothetical protein
MVVSTVTPATIAVMFAQTDTITLGGNDLSIATAETLGLGGIENSGGIKNDSIKRTP